MDRSVGSRMGQKSHGCQKAAPPVHLNPVVGLLARLTNIAAAGLANCHRSHQAPFGAIVHKPSRSISMFQRGRAITILYRIEELATGQ